MDVFEFIFWLNVFFVKENFFFFIRNLFGGKEVNFKKKNFYKIFFMLLFIDFLKFFYNVFKKRCFF